DSPVANSNLCGLYVRARRYGAAIEQCTRSINIEPNPRGYTNLSSAYYFLKRYPEAVQPARQAVDLADANYQYWGNLADAYRWAGAHDQAIDAYRQAIKRLEKELDPRNARLQIRLAVYYASVYKTSQGRASNDDRTRALEHTARALQIDRPSSSYVLYRSALVYEQ